jgi:hypothetical protein
MVVKGRLLMGGEDAGPVTGKELLGAMRVRKSPPAIGGGSKVGGENFVRWRPKDLDDLVRHYALASSLRYAFMASRIISDLLMAWPFLTSSSIRRTSFSRILTLMTIRDMIIYYSNTLVII